MIESRYRRDYDGEFVIVETRWANGRKEQKREWVPNPIVNQHISGRAAVIGSRSDVEMFDYRRLVYHKGGLLGKKKLQTYGCGELWRDMIFDFFVATDEREIEKIRGAQYQNTNIVYTLGRYCIEHPGEFYLTPLVNNLHPAALAAYLAAFDGHQEVFLLGYNLETAGDNPNYFNDVNQIFQAYPQTKFYLVGVVTNMPAIWRQNINVECMVYRDWISYCDV